jgi:hypothetical protein
MPIPRSGLHTPTEVSALVSPRDAISPAHNWKAIADAARRASALTDQASVLSAKASRPKLTSDADYGLHQWRVYNFPIDYRAIMDPDFDLTKNWRTFRVRCGLCYLADNNLAANITYNPLSPVSVIGTDGIGGLSSVTQQFNAGASDNSLFQLNSGTPQPDIAEFEIADAAYSYIWLELNEDLTVEVKCGSDFQDHPDAFTTPYRKLLAEIDTLTPYFVSGMETPFAIVRQFVNGPVEFNPTPRLLGPWTSAPNGFPEGYPAGAVVTHTRTGSRPEPYTGVWQSLKWFNTDEPAEPSGWALIGEYQTTP